jgi:hypothetical protein
MLVMDMPGVGTGPTGNLDKGHLKFRKDAGKDLLLVLAEVATGLLPDDLEMIDEHPGGIEVHLRFSAGGMSHLTQTEGGLLGIHHHEFNEALGKVCGVGGLLDLGHKFG